jgi:hypothetical protein
MRLLDTKTLELHEFFDNNIPKYAILSHRWEAGEVSFQDVTQRRNRQAPGWNKIKKFCAFACENRYKWAWVDTCSIDKTSSTELSEAINSMYKWYENSNTCFVYLCEVECEARDVLQLKYVRDERGWKAGIPVRDIRCSESTASALRKSQWFTRGWTLQELLAPKEAIFLDRYWRIFGSRGTLNGLVSSISGIEDAENAMWDYQLSIATRMSWASKRRCTRSEDMAYSLMGIFKVNMPLLYGEGSGNAFKRLQLEILKISDDESIFAWYPGDPWIYSHILADSPSAFARSSNIRPFEPNVRRKPYAMTNKGLEITTVILTSKVHRNLHYLPLNCYEGTSIRPLAIPLYKNATNGTYVREDELVDSTDALRLPEESNLEIRGFKGPSMIHVVDCKDDLSILNRGPHLDGLRSTMDRYLSLGQSDDNVESAPV